METRLSIIAIVFFLTACNNASENNEAAMDASKNQNGGIVTTDNFARAESDMYFANSLKRPGAALGKMQHDREIAPVDNQPVIRYNRDVLVSSAVFDLDAGTVTITLPNSGERFLSILVVNEDHYNPIAEFGGGTYTLTKENIGTRYAIVALRMFIDPNDPKDLERAHALQDSVKVDQPGGPGKLELPVWDSVSQNRIRDSLLIISRNMIDFNGAFGTKDQVDPAKHLIGTASGWGGNPSSVAVYKNFTPAKNDGITKYKLHVPANVPVDAFWSVAMYNAKGYFEKNDLGVYNLNSVTSKKNKDGSVDIQFGGCDGKTPNCIPIVNGWNYLVRLYRPHKEIIDGSWKFPEAQPVK